jgi:type IX secretion system PorP/SprF family membrane protein
MTMMKWLAYFMILIPVVAAAQSDQHYTMFMYNKLLYNPAYAGSRDVFSLNGVYRDQWDKINGAPKTMNLSVDAPVGTYMKPFRQVALGMSVSNEKLGVESNTVLKAYYAYRIQFNKTVLSLGLAGGVNLYSANYNKLNLYQQNDPNFSYNIRNAALPNFGAGAYWSADDFYCGFSVPNILEDYYDKHEVKINNKIARQIRAYYLSGGYVYTVNETVRLLPQVLMRYAINTDYRLPFSCDFNLTGVYMERFMCGFTYRTDKSIECIVHIQATKKLNVGYAFDYMVSGLNGYNGGTHELVIGYDIMHDVSKFLTPRFIKKF